MSDIAIIRVDACWMVWRSKLFHPELGGDPESDTRAEGALDDGARKLFCPHIDLEVWLYLPDHLEHICPKRLFLFLFQAGLSVHPELNSIHGNLTYECGQGGFCICRKIIRGNTPYQP